MNQFMKESIQNLLTYRKYIKIELFSLVLMAIFCLGFSGQIYGQRGGNLRCNSANYTSAMVALQGSPATTKMLAKAPFIHDEVVSFIVRPKPFYAVMTTDAGRAMDALAVDNPVISNPVSDSLELVKLYNATNGPSWTNNTNWLVPGKAIGTWYGITVNGGGCVTCIDLDGSFGCLLFDSNKGNNLIGNIPNINLPNLQSFSLSCNQVSGSIPCFNLPHLQYLYLSYNKLSGSVPNFNLPKLQYFNCSNNQLSSSIPNFSNLPQLQYFWCNNNQLNGSIPNFSNLPNLQRLDCSVNKLSGSIPNFSNLPNLGCFWCTDNQISDSIPNFSNLPNLNDFRCFNNQLSGSIPNFLIYRI